MASCNTLKIWMYCGTAAKHYPYKIPTHLSQAGSLLGCPKPSKKSSTFRKFSSSAVIQKSTSNDVTEVKKSEIKTATYTQKAKENAKTASYGMVIVVGVGVTGVVLYTVLSELFSGDSPTALFQMASDKCVEHPQVQDLLGEPIKAFGEEHKKIEKIIVYHTNIIEQRLQYCLKNRNRIPSP